MSVIDNLIYNRSEQDLEQLRTLRAIPYGSMTTAQKQLWNAVMKGAYNATDMNRVGEAVNYLVNQLNEAHQFTYNWTLDSWLAWDEFWAPEHWEPTWVYPLSITARTNWAVSDRPTQAELATYLQNVDTVTSCIAITRDLPASMEQLTLSGANAIEQALLYESMACLQFLDYMEELITQTQKAWYYSDDLYGGEI